MFLFAKFLLSPEIEHIFSFTEFLVVTKSSTISSHLPSSSGRPTLSSDLIRQVLLVKADNMLYDRLAELCVGLLTSRALRTGYVVHEQQPNTCH